MKILKKMIDPLFNWYREIVMMKWYQKMIYWIIIFWIFFISLMIFVLMPKIKFWIFGFILIVMIFIRMKLFLDNMFWRSLSRGNIFIFGAKGRGKDQIIQLAIKMNYGKTNLIEYMFNRKRKGYLTNIKDGYHYGFGGRFESPIKVFNLSPNTYDNLINDDVIKLKKNEDYEGRQYVLSDASTIFPSHADATLKKQYPSFGLYYALSRQLYDMNIIVNTQVGGRLWILLREQVQDGYIEALHTTGWSWLWQSIPIIRNYVVVKARYYRKVESAEMGLLPFKKVAIANRVLDKTIYMTTAGATKEQYNATHGEIYEFTVFMKRKYSYYDTRYFESVFFGEKKKKVNENEKGS